MSKLLRKEQCPQCLDSGRDNLAVYSDGAHCFACQYSTKDAKAEAPVSKTNYNQLLTGSYENLPLRKLTKETCERIGIKLSTYTGRLGQTPVQDYPVAVFEMVERGTTLFQRVRDISDSSMLTQLGQNKKNLLFGMHAFAPNPNFPITITEGEFDAASVYQATGYAAVSIINGAGNAAKAIAENMEWLQGWKHVILAFDNDAVGQKAVEDVLPLFNSSLVAVAKFPLKDANEMVVAGRGEEIKKILWQAEVIKPKTIVGIADLMEEVLIRPTRGQDYPWETLTEMTYGFRPHEITVVASDTGTGKTELVKEIVFHFLEQDMKIGMFSLEQNPVSTVQRMIGSKLKKRLHLPGESWDEAAIASEGNKFENQLFLYDTRRSKHDINEIIGSIRFLVKCHGVKMIVIDNLTALCSDSIVDGKHMRDSEYVGYVMNKLFTLVRELPVSILLVSHLATDKIGLSAYVSTSPKKQDEYLTRSAEDMDEYINKPGMHWESGRMPRLENIFGSGTVRKLADYIFALARNRTSQDDVEHRVTRVKCLKSRLDSSMDGKEFKLIYDYDTGRLLELDKQEKHAILLGTAHKQEIF